MARKSSKRPQADPSAAAARDKDEVEAVAEDATEDDAVEDSADDAIEDTDEEADEEADADRSLWEEVRIDPVEIALPAGTGYTLRAYRSSTELTPTDTSERDEDDVFAARARQYEDDEDDDETVVVLDDEFPDEVEEEETPRRRRGRKSDDDAADDLDEVDDEAAADEDEEAEEEEEEAGEDVPVFLSHKGKLLLFRSASSLVSYVRSGAPNDLAQVDSYATLAERLEPADVAPLDDDSYELDLVVENLRGGHDTWDPNLLIEAGEVARDLAYALRMPALLDMLSPGSSLDDLDEALRKSVDGGVGGFLGRRRLKKIGAQTASLGWRTIIGKISAAVDWRD